MLMRFWSEISRMFLFYVFGVDYFKAKNMYSIVSNNFHHSKFMLLPSEKKKKQKIMLAIFGSWEQWKNLWWLHYKQ